MNSSQAYIYLNRHHKVSVVLSDNPNISYFEWYKDNIIAEVRFNKVKHKWIIYKIYDGNIFKTTFNHKKFEYRLTNHLHVNDITK